MAEVAVLVAGTVALFLGLAHDSAYLALVLSLLYLFALLLEAVY